MEVIHFNSLRDRLNYLKGNYEEIIPKVAEPEEIIPKVAEEEKPKKKRTKKKKEAEDEVQAE